jgi:hypothetical protein
MIKLERWEKCSGSRATNVEELGRWAAENDLSGDGELLGGPDEIRSEWAEFFEGDLIVELTEEEWSLFVREYETYLGRGL